jgi:hypothetical protein
VPEEVLQNWQTHYAVEPWGNEQELLARLVSRLSILVAMKSGNKDDFVQVQDLMPIEWLYRRDDNEQTPEQQQAVFAKAFKGK